MLRSDRGHRGCTESTRTSSSAVQATAVLPWSAECVATYGEVRLNRRTVINQTIWSAAAHPDPVDLDVVGPFHVTVDSFDGTVVRGRFSGSLDLECARFDSAPELIAFIAKVSAGIHR